MRSATAYASKHNGSIVIKSPLDVRYFEEWLNETSRLARIKTGIFSGEFKKAIGKEYSLRAMPIDNAPIAYIYRKICAAVEGGYKDSELGLRLIKNLIYRPSEFIKESANISKDLEIFENLMLADDDTKSWWFNDNVQAYMDNIRSLGNELRDIKQIFIDLVESYN